MKRINRILIANRGEIACRVMRSARKMGIETIAVFSEADKNAQHVRMADFSHLIGPAPSSQSYLNQDRILEACLKYNADAVHPGYGFLSENSTFMAKLDQNGIIFIGPHAKSIDAMGDKIHSKKLATDAGVNVIPGFIGEVGDDPSEIIRICKDIGYPVMIKASAGGGGKGMRMAFNDKEAVEGYKYSKAEARSSFGDDRILIEKFIEEPRHIEVQLLGDKHGNVCYLPERECSIQRRNQKVVEEAPSPFIDPETRVKMGRQAVALAQAVNYESSGTVEFMVGKNRDFYFLEMNTRLQVEHPITEAITGIDIVEEMINVAQGKPLSFKQEDVKINGHAVESRVYAEDPYRGFLPSIGHLLRYIEPKGENIRIDTGVREGDEISMFYDPIISKTVTWGPNRQQAIDLMKEALDSYVIRGLGHNTPFCRDVLRQPNFVKGTYTTKFIPETYPKGFTPMDLELAQKQRLAVIVDAMKKKRDTFKASGESGPYVVKIGKEYFAVSKNEGGNLVVEQLDENGNLIGEALTVNQVDLDWDGGVQPLLKSKIDGKEDWLQYIQPFNLGFRVLYKGHYINASVLTPLQFEHMKYMPDDSQAGSLKEFQAPMPGAVVSVSVKDGDEINIGQELGVLEAMKMQNVLRAERPGRIKKVLCKAGESVQVDQVLFEFE